MERLTFSREVFAILQQKIEDTKILTHVKIFRSFGRKEFLS